MFNILTHKRNTNENYTEIPFHPSQEIYNHENKYHEILVRMGERGTLIHFCWEYKLVQPL
jgi:hypothetical protein